jgi:hypothetical protein
MKFKNTLKLMLFFSIIIGINSCKEKNENKTQSNEVQKEPKIVNGINEIAYNEIKKMNLDSTYTDLLDRRNVSESEYKIVVESWYEFHKKVSQFIKKENFKWEVPDSTITILNRIYFDKSGTIDYYLFRIRNASVSAEKQTEYQKVLQKFSEEVTLNLKRVEKYAQCGKIKYLNY